MDLPIAAYHVSGEYAMIKAGAEKGWVDEEGQPSVFAHQPCASYALPDAILITTRRTRRSG